MTATRDHLHHAILGVGGVGGLMAGSLARSGASVTLVVRPESLAGYPEQLRLESERVWKFHRPGRPRR